MTAFLSALELILSSVVIPVEFPDCKFTNDADGICALVSSSASYLDRQFGGEGKFSFEVAPVVSLKHNYKYYGENSTARKDEKIGEAVIEACRAIAATMDFSSVDNIILITAGPSESDGAGEDWFWPQQSSLSAYNLSLILKGRKLDRFAICSELGPDGKLSGTGDFCHEFCHFLKLNDLYDTDGEGSGGLAPGLGERSLMAEGNRKGGGHNPPDFCCVEYDQLEIGKKTVLEKGAHRMEGETEMGSYSVLPSTKKGKYHLIENRYGELMVIRINKSNEFAGFSDYQKRNLTAKERWDLNEVNNNPKYQEAELLNVSGYFGSDSLAVVDITKDGRDFLFRVIEPITINKIISFQDGITISWSTEIRQADITKAGLAWLEDDDNLNDVEVAAMPSGFSYTINGLKPGTSYLISPYIATDNGQSFSQTIRVSTQSYFEGSKPFIILDSEDRNPDGSFSAGATVLLRIRNALDAEQTVWYFNGGTFSPDSNGYWRIPGKGRLEAKISWSDGSMDIISKQIVVK